MMSEIEIRYVIQGCVLKICHSSGVETVSLGSLMKEVVPLTKGKADGALVSRLVKEYVKN